MKGFQNVRYKIPKSKINKTMKAKKYNFFKKISKINQFYLLNHFHLSNIRG